MIHNTIALICDCDSTLTPDTSYFLLEQNGIDNKSFWGEVEELVKNGWDPPLAWMTKMLRLIESGDIEQNTNKKFQKLGKKILPYNGVADFISEIRTKISENNEFVTAGVTLECYIVSQGIQDLIQGCPAFSNFQVFGSQFGEDPQSGINSIKSIVTFTEKTKFLFAINKDISALELRKSPYLVNKFVPPEERKVPFDNMIYFGDSPNDIPCFSLVQRMGGICFGITGGKFRKGFELAIDDRITVGPYTADYTQNSELRKVLGSTINNIADKIVLKQRLAGRL